MVEEGGKGLQALIRSGISRSAAKVLLYIAMEGSVQSIDIESDVCLGQSGVSSAIRELNQYGWLQITAISSQTKGRPRHIYSLSKPFNEIVDDVERMEENRILSIRSGLEDLRRMKVSDHHKMQMSDVS